MPSADAHVVLVGLMGAGKTSVGRVLAPLLGRVFVDNDAQLLAATGETAAQVAEADGLDRLHRLEAEVLADVLARRPGAVVAAPASTAELPGADDLLAPHVVVWLDTEPAVIASRIDRVDDRPLGAVGRRQVLEEQAVRRRGAYERLADLHLHTGTSTAEELARQVAGLVSADPG